MRKEYRELKDTVYPSKEKTLSVIRDEEYDGAHVYYARNCTVENGKAKYLGTEQQIRFVKRDNTGIITPGLQSEQLILILIDRIEHLNKRFPSDENVKMIAALEMFIEACRERVDGRIDRGVMGELKE